MRTHTHTHMHTHARTHTHAHARTHTHTHAHTRTRTHTHTTPHLVGLLMHALTDSGAETLESMCKSSVMFPVKWCPKQSPQGREAVKELTAV